MSEMTLSRLIVVALLVACAPACEDTSSVPAPGREAQRTSPLENREAEDAAIWVSGELTAPLDLYDRIATDLAAIRAEYLDSIPRLSIEFISPWLTDELIVDLTPSAREAFLRGDPTEFGELNERYGVTSLDTFRLRVGKATRLELAARRHPARLAEIYEASSEVVHAGSNGLIGDRPNLYPAQTDTSMTYLLRDAWGDCPAGCIQSEYWYFRRQSGTTEYVGTFLQEYGVPPPDWWDEAQIAILRYFESERNGGASWKSIEPHR